MMTNELLIKFTTGRLKFIISFEYKYLKLIILKWFVRCMDAILGTVKVFSNKDSIVSRN